MQHYQYSYKKSEGFAKSEIEFPQTLADDEIIVKNLFVGICGSDLFHHFLCKDEELYLGHEWIGEVLAIGKNCSNVSLGDWVTTSATLGCGECNFCRKGSVNFCENPTHLGSNKIGAFRSYLKFKAFNALKLKAKDSSEALIEVMAVAEEALNLVNQSITSKANNALVLGGGTVGILCAHLLNLNSTNVTLLEVCNERVKRARSLNIKSDLLKKELLIGVKNSYDLIIDATSDREFPQGGLNFVRNFMAKHSLLLVIGKYTNTIEFTPNNFSQIGAKIVFMRGVPLPTLQATINKWSGKLLELHKKLVTHEFSSNRLNEAFELAHQASKSGKVLIKME